MVANPARDIRRWVSDGNHLYYLGGTVSTLHRTCGSRGIRLHSYRLTAWRCLAMSPFSLPIGKLCVNA